MPEMMDKMLQALSDEQLLELERMVDAGASDAELEEFLAGTGVEMTEDQDEDVDDMAEMAEVIDEIGEEA